MSPKGATFWRKAGLNYLQYLTIATRAVRAGMKEPLRVNAASREACFYNRTIGFEGVKTPVTSSLPKL